MNHFFLKIKILRAMWEILDTKDFFMGPTIERFEKLLCSFTESRYAIAVSSGTDALILSLKALGIGYEDEVIVPAISFASTASAVSWIGARPVFVDINLSTYTIDVNMLESARTSRTKAVMLVHLNGAVANIDETLAFGRKYKIFIISDASQAIGARYKNRPIGYGSDVACLSLGVNKGEFGSYGNAGAILTNNEALYKKLLPFRLYGAPSSKEIYLDHRVASGSYRMDSFQAAALNCKIPHWHSWIERQHQLFLMYKKLLHDVPNVILPADNKNSFHSGFRFVLLTPRRDEIRKHLQSAGIRSRPYYDVPLPFLPAFKSLNYLRGNFPNAEKFAQESITLPTDLLTTKQDVLTAVEIIKNANAVN